MKNNYFKVIALTIGVLILGFVNFTLAAPQENENCENCVAGGPGSNGCSVTIAGVTYSVECKEGYYACCNPLGASCCDGS